MTHDDAPDFLDPGTADRILNGAVAPADTPPGYAAAASVLDAARSGIAPPAMDFGALAGVATASVDPAPSADGVEVVDLTSRRSPVLAKLLTVKVAAIAGIITLGAGTAAAATGVLPGPAQRVAHSAFSAVGVDVPSGDDSADDVNEVRTTDHDEAEDAEDSTTTSSTLPVVTPPVEVPPAPPVAAEPADDEGDDDYGSGSFEQGDDDQGEDHGTVATSPSHDDDDDHAEDHSDDEHEDSHDGSHDDGEHDDD